MATKSNGNIKPVRKSESYRDVYSQVQQFSVSDTEVVISFLRTAPNVVVQDDKIKTVGLGWVNEVAVYIPISQAQSLCEILSTTIDKHLSKVKTAH